MSYHDLPMLITVAEQRATVAARKPPPPPPPVPMAVLRQQLAAKRAKARALADVTTMLASAAERIRAKAATDIERDRLSRSLVASVSLDLDRASPSVVRLANLLAEHRVRDGCTDPDCGCRP